MKIRYNTYGKLSSKVTSLVLTVSCISVLMLMVYLGASITGKGTFTLDEVPNNDVSYYCGNGHNAQQSATGATYYCCENVFFQSFMDPSYCVSEFYSLYSSEVVPSGNNDGKYYCLSEDTSFCDGLDSNYDAQLVVDESNVVCKFLCKVPATFPVSCTFNGVEGIVDENGICQNVEPTCNYGSLGYDSAGRILGTVVVSGEDTAGVCCPDGWTEFNDNECMAQVDEVNHRYRKWAGGTKCINVGDDIYSEEANSEWCVLVDNGSSSSTTTCNYGSLGYDSAGRILGTVVVSSEDTAGVCCPDGWTEFNDNECMAQVDDVNHRYRKWAGGTKCINVGDDIYSEEANGEWCILVDNGGSSSNQLEPIDGERCQLSTGTRVYVASCEPLVSGDCSSNPTANANVKCNITGGGQISRCDLSDDMSSCPTSTPTTTPTQVPTTVIENTTIPSNVDSNAQTGSTAIIIAWIIGIVAVGYAFYYFRQTS